MATKTNTEINGQKYYRIRRTVGYEIVDGEKKPIIKNFYGSSKTDAEKMYDDYKDKQMRVKYEGEQLLSTASLHMRAVEYIKNALEVSDKYAANTKKKYKNCYYNHIEKTWLDKMVARDITAADIQRFYNEADVTKAVLETMQKFMKGFYKWMSRNGYAHDVLSAVEIPKKKTVVKKEEIEVWTDAELDKIKSRLSGRRDKFLFLTLIYTGVRISELLGLKYDDIWDDTIHIRRQYNSGQLTELKTSSSRREIPMHPALIETLPEHESKYRDGDFIFTTKGGKLYNDANLRREAQRFYDSIGVARKTFHAYRATFCTNLCRAEVPLEVASKLLGHKSVEVTAKYYTFVGQERKKAAIDKLP